MPELVAATIFLGRGRGGWVVWISPSPPSCDAPAISADQYEKNAA